MPLGALGRMLGLHLWGMLWDGAQPFVLCAPCHPTAPVLPKKGHFLQDLVADRVTKQPRGSLAMGLQHTRVRKGSGTVPGMSLSLLE